MTSTQLTVKIFISMHLSHRKPFKNQVKKWKMILDQRFIFLCDYKSNLVIWYDRPLVAVRVEDKICLVINDQLLSINWADVKIRCSTARYFLPSLLRPATAQIRAVLLPYKSLCTWDDSVQTARKTPQDVTWSLQDDMTQRSEVMLVFQEAAVLDDLHIVCPL